jgi:pimeloyl-ACP methyl ester carboxylesterase
MSLLHRILRKPFFGRFEVPWQWPEGTEQARWERVNVTSASGATLAGLWGAATGSARASLVLAHPMGKAAKGFWLRHGHAEFYREAGFNVLLVDANGFGESAPHSFDYAADFLGAGLFALQRESSLPVGLIGASFGAGWGLCAMARPKSPFRFAVLEAVFPTLPEFWRHYPVAHAALRASQVVWPSLERRMRPEQAAREVVGSPDVLLLYGDADEFTPPAHGERLRAALAGRAAAHLHVVEGIGHTYLLRDAAERYRSLVLPFLTSALARVSAAGESSTAAR